MMIRKAWLCAAAFCSLLCAAPLAAQNSNTTAEANSIVAQITQASNDAQRDVSQLRIDKWKIDGDAKRRAEARAESISRNLAAALPGMLDAVRVAPNSLAANFKLYRNLSALNDPMAALADDAANGPKEDRNALTLDLEKFERARLALGERLERLSASADNDLARFRTNAKNQPAAGPKRIVIDDTEPPPRKPRRKSTTPQSTQ
jgi:hypothetical protein